MKKIGADLFIEKLNNIQNSIKSKKVIKEEKLDKLILEFYNVLKNINDSHSEDVKKYFEIFLKNRDISENVEFSNELDEMVIGWKRFHINEYNDDYGQMVPIYCSDGTIKLSITFCASPSTVFPKNMRNITLEYGNYDHFHSGVTKVKEKLNASNKIDALILLIRKLIKKLEENIDTNLDAACKELLGHEESVLNNMFEPFTEEI